MRQGKSAIITTRLLGIAVFLVLVADSQFRSYGIEEPEIVEQEKMHCSVASAETILRYYGDDSPELSQRHLALMHCARLPEIKTRIGWINSTPVYYPNYKGTNFPTLSEILIDHGYTVIYTKKSITEDGRGIKKEVVDILLKHLESDHLGLLSTSGHSMVITGYDPRMKRIHFEDPARPLYPSYVALKKFTDPTRSWHLSRRGRVYKGWDGRLIIFWKPATDEERKLNSKDRCPACGEYFPGKRDSFCYQCNAFIDRRSNNQVQRGLDLIALSTENFNQTAVDLQKMRNAYAKLSGDMRISEKNWRTALINYPLEPVNGSEVVTLRQYMSGSKHSYDTLSTTQLENIVASGDRWKDLLPE